MAEDIRTGKIRHRISWLGKLVLQVEVKPGPGSDVPQHLTHWRDATIEDVTEKEAQGE